MTTSERVTRYRHALYVAARGTNNKELALDLMELRDRLRLKTTAEYHAVAAADAELAAQGGKGEG